ncbi:MAG: hypothetical protein ACRD0Q_12395 [Acidimicrobiales bacterium]
MNGTSTEAAATPEWRRRLPMIGLVAAAWAVLPPYTGPELDTATRVEVADHVVPGALVLLVAAFSLGFSRRALSAPTAMLVAGLTVTLAGLWMTFTHVPLVVQAVDREVSLGAAVYHTLPGVAVLVLGLVWAAAYWRDSA